MARFAEMGLFFVLAMTCVTMGPHLSAGQVAPAPAPDCTNDLLQLVPCLSFLTNSSITTVVPTCCSALTNVSTSSPACLCELLSPAGANQSAGLGINDTRALELPGLCSLSLNAASCSAILGPVLAPSPDVLAPAPADVIPAPAVLAPAAVVLSPSPSITPVLSPVSEAPSGPAEDCSGVTTKLANCAEFLTDATSSPSDSCCTNLGDVVTTTPGCLCQLVENSASLAGAFNATRITELPSLCSLSVSLSNCTSGAAAGSPTGSEGPAGSGAKPIAATSLLMVIGLSVATLAHALLH